MNQVKRKPRLKELLATVLLASAISFTLAISVAFLIVSSGREIVGADVDSANLAAAIQVGVVGPLIETALMAGMVSFLFRPLLGRDIPVMVASALAWSCVHGLFDLYWGVVVFLPFLVYTKVYLKFLRFGFRWGFAAATATHGLHNLAAIFLLYLWENIGQ